MKSEFHRNLSEDASGFIFHYLPSVKSPKLSGGGEVTFTLSNPASPPWLGCTAITEHHIEIKRGPWIGWANYTKTHHPPTETLVAGDKPEL